MNRYLLKGVQPAVLSLALSLGWLSLPGHVQAQLTCNWVGGGVGTWFDATDPRQFQIGINSNWDCPGNIDVGGIQVGVVNYPHNPLPTPPYFTAEINDPAVVAVFGFVPIRISNLNLGSQAAIVEVLDAASFGIQNTGGAGIVNGSGQIRLANTEATGFVTDLLLDGVVTLRGGGDLVMGDSLANRVIATNAVNVSSTLVVEDFTVRGGGQLGVKTLSIRNLAGGVIRANESTRLQIDPGPDNNIKNEGRLEAVAGATLRIMQTAVSNEGGTIFAGMSQDGRRSIVELVQVTVSNGELVTEGSGVIRSIGTVTLEGPMELHGSYEVGNASITRIDGDLFNTGNIHIGATAPSPGQFGNTQLMLIDNLDLRGGGTITMSNFNANHITTEFGEFNLLHNIDHTISGSGLILNVRIDNEATIRANQSTPLVLQPAGGIDNFINTGLIEAVDGATLVFRISDFRNDFGGRVQAIDSTIRLEGSATIVGGDVELMGTSELQLSDSTVDASTINNSQSVIRTIFGGQNRLTGFVDNPVGGRIVINDATSLIFDTPGVYQNAGTIELAGQGVFTGFSATVMLIDGDVELEGGGEVIMSNTSDNVIMSVFGVGSVLFNEDNFIHGGGQIGRNVMGIVNRATIAADQPFLSNEQPGVLTIDPGGIGDIINFANQGTLRATDGGTLLLLNGDYDNSQGGIMEALDGSRIDMDQAVTIRGGHIRTSGSGEVHVTREVTFDGVGMDLNGKFVVENTGLLRLIGEVTNHQEILLQGGRIRVDGEVTLQGGGEINLDASGLSQITSFPGAEPDDRLVNETNVIQGVGFIGLNLLPIVNRGRIDANLTGVLQLDPGGPGELLDNDGGTLQATEGGTLRLRPGTYENGPGGVIQALTGSTVELDNLLTIRGGVIAGLDGGIVRAVGGGATGTTLDGVNGLALLGRYEIAQFAATTLKGDITNSAEMVFGSPNAVNSSVLQWMGEVFLDGGGKIALSNTNLHIIRPVAGNSLRLINEDNSIIGAGQIQGNITNNGTIRAEGGLLIIDPFDNGSILNHGHLETSASGNIEMRFGPFLNSGRVLIAGGSNFDRMGDYVQTDGATIVHGTLLVTVGSIQIQGGILGGSGQIVGNIVTGATTAPGDSPGLLAIDGNYTAQGSSVLEIDIAGTMPGDQHDVLQVTGMAALDGTLAVRLLSNGGVLFRPGAETSFQILTATEGVTGEFDQVVSATRGVGATFNLQHGSNSVSLNVLDTFLLGDYNESGTVEQADLDLALLNWGRDGTTPPAGWVSDLPMGQIDQGELDKVLLNWGNTFTSIAAAASIPEPQGLVLACAIAIACSPFVLRRLSRVSRTPAVS